MRGLLLWLCVIGFPTVLLAVEEVVFASYNLENYLGAEQALPPTRTARPKPEHAIVAQIGII